MTAKDAGPVVCCCATAEATSMRQALVELETAGHTVEIVDGVEHDPKKLEGTIERLHGDGMYVLYRSADLGRERIEQLREILLRHQVPFARTITVASSRPRDLVDRIQAAIARAGTRRGKPDPESVVTRPRATLIGVAPPRKNADAAFEDALTGRQPALSRAMLDPKDDRDPAGLDPPTIKFRDPPARNSDESDAGWISLTNAAVLVDDDEHDVDSSLAGFKIGKLDFSDLESIDSSKLAPPPFPAVRTGNTSVAAVPLPPMMPSPSTIPGPPMPKTTPVPARTIDQRDPLPRAPAVSDPGPRSAASTVAVGPAIAPPMSSIGSASGFASMASVSAPAGAAASHSIIAETAQESSSRGTIVAAGLMVAAGTVLWIVWLLRGDGDEPDKTAATDPPAAADKSNEGDQAPARPPDEASDEPGDDGPIDDERADDVVVSIAGGPLFDALADRKVRALDILLVQPQSAGPMTHADATSYCDALDLAGRSGWRLPELGELSSLTDAGMVGPAMYWSKNRGDTFGDTHLVWHGAKRRVLPPSGPSRVLCVHADDYSP